MISLKPIIDLLKNKPAGFAHLWFRQVGGGGGFGAIRLDQLPLPAAWIVRTADKSTPAGERADDVLLGFDVVIAIENAREHYDGEADDILLTYRLAVQALLQGYTLPNDTAPLHFAGGQALEYTASDIYWRDRYVFEALITNYLPDPPAYGSLNFTGEQL